MQGVIIYLAIYLIMNLGVFACILAMRRSNGMVEDIDALAGLSTNNPMMAFVLAMLLFSLAGIPPLAGFFAKMTVVLSALEVGGPMTLLAVLMMLNAAMAAFYYLRVVVYMYMRKPAEDAPEVSIGNVTRVGLILSAAAVIVIGLVPPVTGALLEWTEAAAQGLVALIDF